MTPLPGENVSGNFVLKPSLTHLADASGQNRPVAGAGFSSTTIDPNKDFPAVQSSPFVLHSEESFVIHQGPVVEVSIAGGAPVRKTEVPFALLSINRPGAYRTPLLHSVLQLELLNGSMEVRPEGGSTMPLTKGTSVTFAAPLTARFHLTVSEIGFAQLLVTSGRSSSADPDAKPVIGSSLNEPVVDNE